ncbi:MAG TPA: type II secretion system F family protein [Tepidisphaeraceae bacterium]|jgi:type II secretory pathway component PulF
MAVFAYTALDRQGRQTTGTVPAQTRTAAMDEVLMRGLSPISVEEQKQANGQGGLFSKSASTSTRVPQSAVESFTRELANLLAAGLPLSKALNLLRREASAPGAKNVWGKVHDEVVGGTSLADSLAKWPKVFSHVYVAMVRAGEAGGFLHVVLQQIADFRAREQELKGKVKAAMIYPCVLGVFACCVLTFLLVFFIPKFSGIFKDFGAQLPVLTRGIVALSENAVRFGPFVLVGLIIAAVFIKRSLQTEAGRRFMERVVLKTPALGLVTARFALVRFCRMLGTLVGAGVPLVAALRTARESLGNQTLADAVSHAIEEVQRGAPLSRSLAATPVLFPPSVVEMVAIAEETGRLDKELLRLSHSYEEELDRNLRMLVSLAEPAMLFLTAVVIGIVVVGMLLPILTLQDVVH